MKDVIEESVRLMEAGEPCVMATVVRTKGMTPQKAGAKQLIRKDGSSLGTLGGGCVEGDIWWYAQQMLKEKSGPQFRDYYLNEDIAAKDGLVCGGTMYFYVEPIWQPKEILPFVKEIVKAYNGGRPISIATVVSNPGKNMKLGDRLLIKADGSTSGVWPNKNLQDQMVKVGKRLAPFGANAFLETEDGTGIYIEGFTTPPALVIMGGGHVGRAVYHLAVTLGFRVLVIDDRREFSNKERFPLAEKTLVADFSSGLENLSVNFNTYILIATRGHRYDDSATHAAVKTPARYIGLLGSKRKNLLIFRELLKHEIPIDRIREIHAPVGLNIGALTAEELAVSIMAEIIMCMRGGDGASMKMDTQNLIEQIENVPAPAPTPVF